jgi:copper resistance protein D
VISVWVLVRWLHLLAAITWIGGMLFILLVLLPVVRPVLSAQDRTLLVGRVGTRYGYVSVVALILLLVTGYLNGEHQSVNWSDLTETDYGTRLLVKLVLVGLIIVVTALHTWYGRRIVALAERAGVAKQSTVMDVERRRLQIVSGSLSAVNLILNLAVVWIAASLAT